MDQYREYGFKTGAPSHMHRQFIGPLLQLSGGRQNKARVLDVGCGNGSTVAEFLALGCEVVGIDLSEEGIEIARRTYPAARFECLPADDHILENLQCEPFDVVISTEVIEHLYDPHSFIRGCYRALRPGGRFVLSTPYHGYLKNLLLSFFNRWDRHANPLWRGGHIKLWSRKTLAQLLTETGFVNLAFRGAGRIPYLWMTMLMSGDKPRNYSIASEHNKDGAVLSRDRNSQLDLLRALAILMVVFYHLIQMSPVPLQGLMRVASAGQFGVDLFFVLSGWLIGSLYWKECARFGDVSLWRFWARRWLRTIPPYLAALALAWFAVFAERREPFDWGYLVFIQNYYQRIPYFLVSWSLCTEEHFYLFLPLLLAWNIRKRLPVLAVFVCLIIVAPLSRCLLSFGGMPGSHFGFQFTATHLRMEGLLLGFWAAYFPNLSISLWPIVQRLSRFIFGASTAALVIILLLPEAWEYRFGLTALALSLVGLLVWLVGKKPGPLSSSYVIKWIALTSYSVYLTHALMLHVARKLLAALHGVSWLAYFPMALFFIMTGGLLFYLGVERTSIQLRERWVSRRKGIKIARVPQPC